MSEKVLCEKSDLVAIADAVREATGSTENYNVSELSVATVGAISSANPILQDKTVTPTALDQIITPDSNYDGLSQVIVKGDVDLKAENITEGVTIFDVAGSNPYEKTATDTEVNAQANLISQIATALEGKAAGSGSGGSVETCAVTIDGTSFCCIQGVVATVVSDGVVETVYLSEGTEGYTGYPPPLVINNVVCNSYLCVKTASTNTYAVYNGEDETNMSVVEVFQKVPTQNNSSSSSCDDLLHVLKAPSASGASGSVKINYVYGK